MNWVSALSPWQWVVLASIPPAIVLLYFLKLKRQPLEVPSTFLWRRTIEDLHVNSLWQKLKQNLLMYLQLLFLTALILACLRPGYSGKDVAVNRLIFMLDNSASMQATDQGTTRLTEAKKIVRSQIQGMTGRDVGMLLAFSDRADVRQGFTGDKRRLLAALEAIGPTHRTTDLTEALRAAAGLANPGRASFESANDIQVADALPAKILIYSDGGFPAVNDFDIGNLVAEYIPIGSPECDNVSITAFSVERNEENENQVEAYARIHNYGKESIELSASIYLEDQLLDAESVSIQAGEEAGINFRLNNLDEGNLRLELDRPDQLALDNRAFAALRPPRQINMLLVTPGNQALQVALTTGPIQKLASLEIQGVSYLESEEYRQKLQTAAFDLVIYDQCAPKATEEIPPSNTLYIGTKPPSPDWTLGTKTGPVFILDIDRQHPIMQYLEMGAVRIIEGQTVTPPESGSVLMTADIGPVMAIAPRGPYQDAVLGFPIVTAVDDGNAINTDWTIKRSFPVFVFAVVEFLGGGVTSTSVQTVQPGQAIAMSLSNRFDRFRIQSPDGNEKVVDRGSQSQWIYTQTEQPGIYQIMADGNGAVLERFAVNLFSPRECDIAALPKLQLGPDSVQASQASVVGRIEYWRWLVWLGLAFLVIEWIVYNRRVFL